MAESMDTQNFEVEDIDVMTEEQLLGEDVGVSAGAEILANDSDAAQKVLEARIAGLEKLMKHVLTFVPAKQRRDLNAKFLEWKNNEGVLI